MIIAITSDELREKIVKLAMLQHRKEYKHGFHGPDYFDCAGLVWYVYNEILGIDIYEEGYGESATTKIMTSKHGVITLYEEGVLKNDLNLIKKGDILLFHRQDKNETEPKANNRYPGHCGIYIGNNAFIHASGTEKRIVISDFNNEYWYKKIVGYKDYEEEFELVKSKFYI